MLKLRLQRFGKKRAPQYRLVVTEKAQKRDGEPVEVLGFYNPKTKELVSNTERLKYWASQGAQASDTVKYLMTKTPIHDLAQGPYKSVAKARSAKEQAKQDLLAKSSKNTKAKKKKAEAEAAAKAEPAAEAA